jgi:hypothetical protein
MKKIRLVAWREDDGRARADVLEALGFSVTFEPEDPIHILKTLQANPPSALVIDLSRSPAKGRDLGVMARVRTGSRFIPLVFAGGTAQAREKVGRVLPDAELTSWDGIERALHRAMESPPADPVVPDSVLAGYSGTPLPKKLGIKEGSRVLLAGAPTGFPAVLGPLPEGASLARRFSSSVGLILWFVRSRRELDRGLDKWVGRVGKEGLWIIWPKQSSDMATDLKQNLVRKAGLDAGLVDYKVAAIDATWSGLKFAVRR